MNEASITFTCRVWVDVSSHFTWGNTHGWNGLVPRSVYVFLYKKGPNSQPTWLYRFAFSPAMREGPAAARAGRQRGFIVCGAGGGCSGSCRSHSHAREVVSHRGFHLQFPNDQ